MSSLDSDLRMSKTHRALSTSPNLRSGTKITMPLQILEGETPTPALWGSMPLEIYVLSEWEAPHSSHPAESPSDRRRRLVRQFLALGDEGREIYTSYPNLSPSLEQLSFSTAPS